MAERSVDPSVIALTDSVIGENYDAGSIARGLGYFEDDRVQLIRSAEGFLASVVVGSGRSTYVVRVRWRTTAAGIVIDDTCSCPLGGFCKHAVATILTARADAVSEIADRDGGGPSWRSVLGGIADDDARSDDPSPLALQFSVSTPRRTHRSPDAEADLAIRPMGRGKRGQWVKTGASWRDLYYERPGMGLDPAQVAALRGLWNASPRHSYYPDTGPIALGSFGPELWLHLRNAADVGVSFVSDQADAPVRMQAEHAYVEVDLTTVDDATVALATRLVVGHDAPIDDGKLGLLGPRPHGLFIACPDGSIDLYRLESPLDPAIRRLLNGPALRIPVGELDELLETYQPILARHARVGSSDASVTITTRRFDGLSLLITRHTVEVASTSWAARYVRGDTTTYVGLDEPGGPGRDRSAEYEAAKALDVPTDIASLLVDISGMPRPVTARGVEAVRLLTEAVPWLEANTSVEVRVESITGTSLPELREATADPLVELDVTDAPIDSDRNDWFDLGVTVTVEGEQVPFASLFTALSLGEPVIVLASGTWLRIDRGEFDRLRALIEEARGLVDADPDADADDGTIRINRFQISWFEELAAL
ncbi:MAG: SWIM zinc finger family protein, partial [Actinobacteria bacterium]|nr:SWIM zinc finger family protein [Actinomycetota bacterium]